MGVLYDPRRHERLSQVAWRPGLARDRIVAVCRDAEAAFDTERLWPVHPGDEDADMPADGIFRGLYLGAAGMVHGLTRLTGAGLHEPALDAALVMEGMYEAALRSPDDVNAGPSLLLGSTGILLVEHRLRPSAAAAGAVAAAIAANVEHPSNKLLLGAPGTMLAARAMHERTGEERFAELWRASARELLKRQDPDGAWTQDLYGEQVRYVGAGHGFAGNTLALLTAAEWLDDPQANEAQATATTRELATIEGAVANWPPLAGGWSADVAPRVQWCHGAPGVITSLARLAPGDSGHTDLLVAGGELIWRAGPVAGNAGLCHGTSGNGFAFLALLTRTGDELWLERAQAFAMHALGQNSRLRRVTGRGRYALFTGDIGAALLAAACLTGDHEFPGLDDH